MKKNIIKKLTAVLLAALFIITALPLYAAENASVAGFSDVKEGKWYAAAVAYVAENELMTGTTATTFEPSTNLTRAMSVLILAKIADADLTPYTETKFTDVPAGKWYTSAVAWADENGVANGTGELFQPGDSVTREQLALMICKFAEKYGIVNKFATTFESSDGFADADRIHSWAKEGVDWAVKYGMISGMGENMLDPRGTATRAQAAQIFYNLDYMKDNSILPPDTAAADAITVGESDKTRFICWGDSHTQGYDDDLREALTGYVVRSYASGGDECEHLAMKMGAAPLYVDPFVIPAAKEKVEIVLRGEDLELVDSLADLGTEGLSPATIGGVKGHIAYKDENSFYFTRSDNPPYEEVRINRLTRVVTKGMSDLKTGDVHIICAHDEFENIDVYMEMLNRMVDTLGSDKYVIIVYPYANYGEALTKEFGDHVIDSHTYFMTQALKDAGIEPTEQDLEDISNGYVPESLRSDDEHGNSTFNALLTDLIVAKLSDLGYLN